MGSERMEGDVILERLIQNYLKNKQENITKFVVTYMYVQSFGQAKYEYVLNM